MEGPLHPLPGTEPSTMANPQLGTPNIATEPPPRSCVVCTESEGVQLLKPCRSCKTDYCVECLLDMFHAATRNTTRMPPKCCTLIQIHTIIGKLSSEEAKQYRTKFEEWISPTKLYCPSPTCSAFISEKRQPSTSLKASSPPTLKSVLSEVLVKLSSCEAARFFRGEMDITELPGFTAVVDRHIDLTIMQNNIDSYRSINEMTIDMRLLVSNAKEFAGQKHPVSIAADELFDKYLLEISHATARLITATAVPAGPQIFGCPTCHIAICSDCKQIDHTGSPCDRTTNDHETAVLAAFGYKKCPRCGTGVKRMFGCPHMQCICGAHWCYWCQRSTEQCDGGCGPSEEDEVSSEEGYDSEEDSEDNEDDDDEGMIVVPSRLSPPVVGAVNVAPAPVNTAPTVATVATANPALAFADYRPVNLDAGGGRRWAEADYDFGSEPDEEPYAQVWSCDHNFENYEVPSDKTFNYGDLDRMECNRCFEHIQPQKKCHQEELLKKASSRKRSRPAPRAKKVGLKSQKSNETATGETIEAAEDHTALECSSCRLLVCPKCRDKYLRSTE